MLAFGILKLSEAENISSTMQLNYPHPYITPPRVVMKSGVGDALHNTHTHARCKTCARIHQRSAAEFHLLTVFEKQSAGDRSVNPPVTFDLQEALQITAAARVECTQQTPCWMFGLLGSVCFFLKDL